jgi:hypothetical protein
MEQEVASSTPRAPDHPDYGTAAVHAMQQHTPAQASRTPSRAAPTALSATRELLCHPPSSTASPRAMKQWRDDVDRLLGMAHSTSSRSRPRSSRRQREATASGCSPSVRGAQTNDLWAELNRRRMGEDAWVSLERARERRQNIEGRNLDRDFAAEAPQTPVGARSQTGVPLAGMGCAALADHLRATSWPPKFRPHLPEKIRRNIKPVRVPAGVRYRHHGSRWKHHCDGNILSCGLVRTYPDLAHEPHPGISLLLGRTLCAVHGELRQCLPTARCGGPPPCSKAGARGNTPEVHLPLHQGTRYDTSYF